MSRDIGLLDLDGSDPEDLFSSHQGRDRSAGTPGTPSRAPTHRHEASSRDEALRKELEKVKGVNQVVENVIKSLQKSRDNMETVHDSVRGASTLLDTWTRILSQTEHNQRLLLNPEWRGATQDLEDLENESVLKQQATERRAAEEEMRREAEARAAEEEEARKRIATPTSSRGGRSRGRAPAPSTRGPVSTRGGAPAAGSAARRTTSATRAGSGIGRGIGGTRGRSRGV